MNIANEIAQIIHELYPLLLFEFGDLIAGKFQINDDKTIIKGMHDGTCT